MPINYDSETGGWKFEPDSEEEEEALIKIGAMCVTQVVGEALYKALHQALAESEDDDTPRH